jgi:hypothetical protein
LELVNTRIKEHGAKHKIDELCLDEIPIVTFTSTLSSLLEKCIGLEYLTLCSCKLSNLTNLPALPNLNILELSDNEYSSQNSDCKQTVSNLSPAIQNSTS